jgi:hypothetical protein
MTAAAAGKASSSGRLGAMLETLDISDFQKGLLRDRWLDQVSWMSRQARTARRRFLIFRIPLIVGGVLIPALITILLSSEGKTSIPWLFGISVDGIRLLAFVTSLTVAVSAGAEEVLKFGERWRHYRRMAELLKTLGWQYLMLNGAFRRYPTHAAAFTAFTERVEDTLNEDVEGYLSAMAGEGSERSKTEVVA